MSKKTRMRACPALATSIESFECATGRHRTISCPESCEFNPFSPANYDSYRDLETAVDARHFEWLMANSSNREQIAGAAMRAFGGDAESGDFHAFAYHAFYRRDASGDTVLEKWEKQGLPGLRGDERIVGEAKLKTEPAFIEVQTVLDDRRVLVVDLLDPSRRSLVLMDKSFAAVAVRFAVYGAYIFHLPHSARLVGAAVGFPSLPPLTEEEVIREIIVHLSGLTAPPSVRGWLRENFSRFDQSLSAVGLARRKAMAQSLDAQFGKAIYDLSGDFEESKKRLLVLPQIQDDPLSSAEIAEGFTEGRVWFANAGDPEHAMMGEGAALGRLLLGPRYWRLECVGGSRLDRFRERFETLMADRVRFSGERRDDIAAQAVLKDPPYDPALVPPRLLRDTETLGVATARIPVTEDEPVQAIMDRHLTRRDVDFLESPSPALSGCSPRDAAKDPGLRAALICLMKQRVRSCDTENLEKGTSRDVNWMLRELGLTEILFDAPPRRARMKITTESENEEYTSADTPEYWNWPLPPALPNLPLTRDEAMTRFEGALRSFARMTEAFEYLQTLGYPLFEDLREITRGLIPDRELQFLAPILSLLVLSFAPKGTAFPEVDPGDLSSAFRSEILSIDPSGSNTELLGKSWLEDSPQPELLKVMLSVVFKLSETAPEDIRTSEGFRAHATIVLRVLVRELDRVMRETSAGF